MKDLVIDDIKGIRKMFKKLDVITAEVDKELRYKWIENPHPDFDPDLVVGKRDDELVSAKEAKGIILFKKKVFETEKPLTIALRFERSNGPCYYSMAGYPVKNSKGRVTSIITLGFYTKQPIQVRQSA
jgi:hypothetical protein